MRRIINAIVLLIIILVFGTVGFMLIDDAGILTGLYMTVITIAAVGYDEVIPLSPGGRIFTIFLIFIGVGFVLFLFREITEVVIEGGLRKTLGRMKMKKKWPG